MYSFGTLISSASVNRVSLVNSIKSLFSMNRDLGTVGKTMGGIGVFALGTDIYQRSQEEGNKSSILGNIWNSVMSFDGLLNAAGIALLFLNPATSVVGFGLFLASSIGYGIKTLDYGIRALGKLSSLDLGGAAGNLAMGAMYAINILPFMKILKGGLLNQITKTSTTLSPISSHALPEGVQIAQGNFQTIKESMTGGIKVLSTNVRAEAGLLRTAEEGLTRTNEQLARLSTNPNSRNQLLRRLSTNPTPRQVDPAIARLSTNPPTSTGRLIRPASLTDDIIRTRQQELTTAASEARRAQEVAQNALTKTTQEQRAQLQQQLEVRTREAQLAQRRLNTYSELAANRRRLAEEIAYRTERVTTASHLRETAITARSEAQEFIQGRSSLTNEQITQLYNGSLHQYTIDRRRFLEEVLGHTYGDIGRTQFNRLFPRPGSTATGQGTPLLERAGEAAGRVTRSFRTGFNRGLTPVPVPGPVPVPEPV